MYVNSKVHFENPGVVLKILPGTILFSVSNVSSNKEISPQWDLDFSEVGIDFLIRMSNYPQICEPKLLNRARSNKKRYFTKTLVSGVYSNISEYKPIFLDQQEQMVFNL